MKNIQKVLKHLIINIIILKIMHLIMDYCMIMEENIVMILLTLSKVLKN